MLVNYLIYAFLIGCAIGWTAAQDAAIRCSQEADIVFLVDSSNSLGSYGFQMELDFVDQMLEWFVVAPHLVRVGLATFSSSAELRFPLNRYSNADGIVRAIKTIPFKAGARATHLALSRARAQAFHGRAGDRKSAPNVVILLTGGQSTYPNRTLPAAQDLKDDGTIVFTIGIGDKVDVQELLAVASSENNVFAAESFSKVQERTLKIAMAVCSRVIDTTIATTSPTLSVTAELPKEDASIHGATVTHLPPKAAVGCAVEADIVFLVDSSNMLGYDGFQVELDFVQQVVGKLSVAPHLVRVGLVTFSSSSELRFPLNRYTDSEGLTRAIQAVPYQNGTRATHLAFSRTHTQVFRGRAGDRRGVANVVILLTRGKSNHPERTLPTAQQLKFGGTTLYVVGIGDKQDMEELSAIASDKDTLFTTNSFGELQKIKKKKVPTATLR